MGGSPYNRTEQELSTFFERLRRFLETAINELDAVPMTFSEYRRQVVSSPYLQPARVPA